MKTLTLLCALCVLYASVFAGEKEVVIVAAGDQQKADTARDQNAGARRAQKLAVLRKWASDNILLGEREIQLQAALAAKLYAQKGNRPFTLQEWQFFDQNTKFCIILGCPQALPVELLDN